MESLLREAVHDPQVLAIKQTIYRTGTDSELMDLLREAVRRGKEVMVVVELKARFDEEANINWAESLEAMGAQVVYGVVGLKTHAKMLLVTRREGRQLRRYAHLSTGNYNPRTARLYTDVGHLTADPRITADMAQVFVHLASQSRMSGLKSLSSRRSPAQAHDRTHRMRGRCGARRQAGAHRAEDERADRRAADLALAAAGRAGVSIDLIVRGACIAAGGVPGVHRQYPGALDHRALPGAFARVLLSLAATTRQLYLSSADWMNRNMLRRIELAWPVNDPALRQRLIDESLAPICTTSATPGTDARRPLQARRARAASPADGTACPDERYGNPLRGTTMDLILWRHAEAEDGETRRPTT